MSESLTKEEIREENRQKVLLAAVECIREVGIQETKLYMVAKRAGVTTRSAQRYYGNREDLLTEAVIYLVDKKYANTTEFFKKFIGKHKTGIELVEQFFSIQKDYFKGNYVDYLVMAEIEAYFYRKKVETEKVRKHIRHMEYMRNLLDEILQEGVRDGTIRADIATNKVAGMMRMAFTGVARRFSVIIDNEERLHDVVNIDEQLDLIEDMLLRYVKSK